MEIESIEFIGTTNDEYVYDLETDDGTYYAGNILLKNTDSCYVTFDISKDDFVDSSGRFNEEEYMKKNFEVANKCADLITKVFKAPSELEMEKLMYPFIIYQKKRYAFQEWTEHDKPHDKLQYKGLSIKRRDSCKYLRDTCDTIFKLLMKEISEDIQLENYLKDAFLLMT